MTTSSTRIALYVGNELYPAGGTIQSSTIQALQASPLTSPILSLLNADSSNNTLVYNDSTNPMFNASGDYIGPDNWPETVTALRSATIGEVYISFSTNGTDWMAKLLKTDHVAAMKIFSWLKNTLGVDGVDLDYESDVSSGSNMYPVAAAAVVADLKLTAAPYYSSADWQSWVQFVHNQGGTVSWLNLQCYAGGKSENPGEWNFIGVPIVAGSCKSCGQPQTTCSPANVLDLFTLWRTGTGTVSTECWDGTPNTEAQTIGGGFIWSYSAIQGNLFLPYMHAIKDGLGM